MDGVESSSRKALAEKQTAVNAQANAIRDMKVTGCAGAELDAAVEALKALKLEAASVAKQLQAAVLSNGNGESAINKEAFHQTVVNTLERHLFYISSFKIYRGVAVFYDYDPPGCAVKSNVLAYWRQYELGVPFAITVDSTASVTIRERDSKDQIRVSIDEVASVVKEVTDGQSTWADVQWRYPAHTVMSSGE